MTGLLSAEGASWQENRHFVAKVLRDLGMGKPILEKKIRDRQIALVELMGYAKGYDKKKKEILDAKQAKIDAINKAKAAQKKQAEAKEKAKIDADNKEQKEKLRIIINREKLKQQEQEKQNHEGPTEDKQADADQITKYSSGSQ